MFSLQKHSANQLISENTIQEIQLRHNQRHMQEQNTNYTSYDVNEYVLVEYPISTHHKGPPSKLMTNLRGPMKIVSKKRDNYTVLDLTTNKTEIIHVKRLHKFYYDPAQTDPRQVAKADK